MRGAVSNDRPYRDLKMPEQGPAQKPYVSDNRKPLNCMAQEFSTSGAHKQMFLSYACVRRQPRDASLDEESPTSTALPTSEGTAKVFDLPLCGSPRNRQNFSLF